MDQKQNNKAHASSSNGLLTLRRSFDNPSNPKVVNGRKRPERQDKGGGLGKYGQKPEQQSIQQRRSDGRCHHCLIHASECRKVLLGSIDGIQTIHQGRVQPMLGHNVRQVPSQKRNGIVRNPGDHVRGRGEHATKGQLTNVKAHVATVSTDKETEGLGNSFVPKLEQLCRKCIDHFGQPFGNGGGIMELSGGAVVVVLGDSHRWWWWGSK
mmetsp:Transcript_24497/g.67826  ORF Transcript_24497/g.67826 Transcript_24497/m.67826 type:complete len:210 (+) Transcript_24497:143-772(+)